MSKTTLYRKYRPQNFADIVNQEHVKTTIQQELMSGQLPHAFLFHGPRGIGKTTSARVLAKALNCEKRKEKDPEPCNSCDSCENITNGKSLNLVEVDAASQTGVDNVRDNIIANARVAVKNDEYKVFIIDEVHMLSTSSFNALLKTLEEPPERVLFILATTEIHKIPDTIISRCQRFDFHPVKAEELKEYLASLVKKEKRKVDDAVLAAIVKKSAGHVRDAMSLLGQVLSLSGDITVESASLVLPVTQQEHLLAFFDFVSQQQAVEALQLLSDLESQGVKIRQYCDSLIDFAHELLLFRVGSHPDIFTGQVSDDQMQLISTIAERYTPNTLLHGIDILMKRRHQLKDYNQGILPLELAVIELTSSAQSIQAPQASVQPTPVAPPSPVTPPTPQPKPTPTPVAPLQPVAPPTPAPNPKPAEPEPPVVNIQPAQPSVESKPAEEVKTASLDENSGIVQSQSLQAAGDGDPLTYNEFKPLWKEFNNRLAQAAHSVFIVMRTTDLREGADGEPVIAFRFQMHHDHVKRSFASLVEVAQGLVPSAKIRFTLVVDENMDYSAGGDVEEPKKVEKEELAQELSDLAEAFGGSLME